MAVPPACILCIGVLKIDTPVFSGRTAERLLKAATPPSAQPKGVFCSRLKSDHSASCFFARTSSIMGRRSSSRIPESYLGGAAHHRLDKVVFVLIGETGQPVYLIEHDLLQEVQPDIVGRRAFAEPGIVVVAAKELDVVVALVKVESQIAAALRAF